MYLYSVYDKKLGVYNSPFVTRYQGEATRVFDGAVNFDEGLVSRYPDDYDLYLIAEFDEKTGALLLNKEYKLNGRDLIRNDGSPDIK